MSVFVTGTDTDVGKTIVSATILAGYQSLGAAYWKPIATGGTEESDSRTILELAPPGTHVLPEVYSFRAPVSPHLAARLEERPIQRQVVLSAFQNNLDTDRPLVIEGIGGLLVPLNEDGWLLADLLSEVGLPVVLVASTRVGTINHTLLSLEAAHQRGLLMLGVVFNGPRNPSNLEAVERFGGVPVIGHLGQLERVDAQSVSRASESFDLGSRLLRALQGTETPNG